MSASDKHGDDRASSTELPAGGVNRRSFLKYFAGAFALAALPEAVDGCSAPPVPGAAEAKLSTVDLSSIPITWVTRKQDGLSLGFQFVNLVSDANHDIALSGSDPAFVAITFPPQHVMEDAIQVGTGNIAPVFDYATPVSTWASGTSRLVFNPAASLWAAPPDGGVAETFPYTLQGMLDLCARSTLVVQGGAIVPDARAAAGVAPLSLRSTPEELRHETISQARIDRVIARVDPRAAHRVRRRALRAARGLNRTTRSPLGTGIRPLDTTGVAAPSDDVTSIELPFRLLMSPDVESTEMAFAFMSSPVVSPATAGVDLKRTELWHARPGFPDPTTGLADPSLGAITLRALWTRDYDVYGAAPGQTTPLNVTDPSTVANDPVENANPTALDRVVIVESSADPALPALNVDRLVLSPLGGTIDLKAQFPGSKTMNGWTQNTVLGRDEYVQTVSSGTLMPFGHSATLAVVTRRNADPSAGQGSVGVLYSETFLVVNQPLVSYHDLPNASDFNQFPFVAVELKQTKIPCAPIAAAGGAVNAPGGSSSVSVGVTGTDYRGNAIQFATPLYFLPQGASASQGVGSWTPTTYAFDRQRIALAPPNDGASASPATYAPDSTSFETVSFVIGLKTPSSSAGSALASAVVPVATQLTIAVEALRHLQSSPAGGTPDVDAVFNYDTLVYSTSGFDPTANPNQIFLTVDPKSVGPTLNFANGAAASNSAGMAAPAFAVSAISRSSGTMSGDTTSKSSALMTGKFSAVEYFGTTPAGAVPPATTDPLAANAPGFLNQIKLFGFIPLAGIISDVESLAAEFMPKSATQALSDAEAFLEKAAQLIGIVVNMAGSSDGTAGQIGQVLTQVTQDITQYGQLAQGIVSGGGTPVVGIDAGVLVTQGTTNGQAPLTNAEMQAAAWLESAAVQAQALIQKWAGDFGNVYDIATKLFGDITAITGLTEVGSVVDDLVNLINAIETILTDVTGLLGSMAGSTGASASPQSAAGAILSYFGPVANAIQTAADAVNPYIKQGETILNQIKTDLGYLQQGIDMAKNLAVEFSWKPKITAYECLDAVAFIPSTDRAFSLDVKVNANSNNPPVGLSVDCRLDSFAICFGQGIKGYSGSGICGSMPVGYTSVIKNADISVVFDHIEVSMLAGSKPDIDCKFKDIYFGGDLSFIETIKNLIPLDSFSDPPFIKVTTSGITAGFTLPIPNIAIGMFSIQNINIGASLNLPWIAPDLVHGVTFDFDFCTISNPFVVTVSMLGGGGFFGLTLDMKGLQRVQFGIAVGAQLAIDLTVASGSVSIEAGIFLVYIEPGVVPATGAPKDPVTGLPEVEGWVIGGYLRLRGELDILGIITISVELYIEIVYESSTGKCIATGYIKIDITLIFFSIHVKVSFTRTFAGSNGDPTFAEMMSPGGVDPMVDPALLDAAPSAEWDPFAEYCMVYA